VIKINAIQLLPIRRTLEKDADTYVVAKRATLADEGMRYEMVFADEDRPFMITDLAAVEIWLSVVECNILDENDQPLLKAGMPYEEALAALTAIWMHDPELFWDIHNIAREANPQWAPPSEGDAEGNS
jgi:hypothetical protein